MPFVVVTYFTYESAYEAMVEPWADRLRRNGVDLYVAMGRRSEGSWEKNTNQKPRVIRQAWQEMERSIVWLDVDAELRQRPELFFELAETDTDFACHYLRRTKRPELLSGTLYFGATERAGLLLDAWCDLAERAPGEWDQRNLQRVVDTVPGLKAVELPAEYCAIDFMHVRAPVVFHRQASRKERRRV